MEAVSILLTGLGSGIFFAIISILIINTSNSEKYPIGGFLPALWMVADLGESSKIEAAGLLMMGGITGFYIMLGFRKLKVDTSNEKLKVQHNENRVSGGQETLIVKGKSLSKFLK